MASVRTAISLDELLLEEADALMREIKVSRSRLLAIALEELLRREQDRELLRRINEAYMDYPDPSEVAQRQGMRRLQRQLAEGEE